MSEHYTENDPVIHLTSKDFKNKKIIHPAFKNKVGFLKIYAPWCSHCISMVDTVNSVSKKLKTKNIVIGVCDGTDKRNKKIMEILEVRGFPTLYLVKSDGSLDSYNQGRDENTLISNLLNLKKKIVKPIKKIIKKKIVKPIKKVVKNVKKNVKKPAKKVSKKKSVNTKKKVSTNKNKTSKSKATNKNKN